ncbi:putative sensory transducer protein YfmS [compost metagenome]
MSMLALAGQQELDEVKASFSRVVEMTQSQNKLVSDLQIRAQEIASLATHIRELADQSGMLAMNASIEAAHAGEHGRGFSIVANEVKKLATQTKEFSGDIGAKLGIVGVLVNETAHATSYTVKEMEESQTRVVEAGLTFGTLVASACQVENRGKEAFDSTEDAAKKNREILHELISIAGRI